MSNYNNKFNYDHEISSGINGCDAIELRCSKENGPSIIERHVSSVSL